MYQALTALCNAFRHAFCAMCSSKWVLHCSGLNWLNQKPLLNLTLVYICYFRDNAPGQRECDEALEQINYTINQLDQASLAAISQQLEPRPENTLQVSYKYITVLSKDFPFKSFILLK